MKRRKRREKEKEKRRKRREEEEEKRGGHLPPIKSVIHSDVVWLIIEGFRFLIPAIMRFSFDFMKGPLIHWTHGSYAVSLPGNVISKDLIETNKDLCRNI